MGKNSKFVSFFTSLFSSLYSFCAKFLTQTHKEGYIFVATSGCATIFVSIFSPFFGLILFVITLWVIAFFRDPVRVTPKSKNVVVSAADGIVSSVIITKPPVDLGLEDVEMHKISVFLSVFNVHVNKFPVEGIVKKVKYYPGKFLNAELDKSSDENERNTIVLTNSTDQKNVIITQIAGLIARRIVCFCKENDKSQIGKNFGLIRFGSRVDVYLPISYKVLVHQGQTCVGGETVIAVCGSSPYLLLSSEDEIKD
jgi:phosphatidylserine decarboxylase